MITNWVCLLNSCPMRYDSEILQNLFRTRFPMHNQIKFDLRSTWCSELIVNQLCFVFPYIFDLQLRNPCFVDSRSTEPTLCRSAWLTMTSICSVVQIYTACIVDSIASKRHIIIIVTNCLLPKTFHRLSIRIMKTSIFHFIFSRNNTQYKSNSSDWFRRFFPWHSPQYQDNH